MPKIVTIFSTISHIKDVFPVLARTPDRINFSRSFHESQVQYDYHEFGSNAQKIDTRGVVSDSALNDFLTHCSLKIRMLDLSFNKLGKKYIMLYYLLDCFDDEHSCIHYLNLSGNQHQTGFREEEMTMDLENQAEHNVTF